MHILIPGGTGTAGRVLTRRAREAGHQVTVLSRSKPDHPHPGVTHLVGNLLNGTGLDTAMRGVDAVVDLSNISTASRAAATRFFTRGTEQLIAAEQRAGVDHHLTVSIVGVDALHSGYYQAKVPKNRPCERRRPRPGSATPSPG